MRESASPWISAAGADPRGRLSEASAPSHGQGGGVDQYYADIERLIRTALGDLSSDERSVAVVASVMGPPTFFALRGRGLPYGDAVALSLELALPWLEQRRDRVKPPTGGRSSG